MRLEQRKEKDRLEQRKEKDRTEQRKEKDRTEQRKKKDRTKNKDYWSSDEEDDFLGVNTGDGLCLDKTELASLKESRALRMKQANEKVWHLLLKLELPNSNISFDF